MSACSTVTPSDDDATHEHATDNDDNEAAAEVEDNVEERARASKRRVSHRLGEARSR